MRTNMVKQRKINAGQEKAHQEQMKIFGASEMCVILTGIKLAEKINASIIERRLQNK